MTTTGEKTEMRRSTVFGHWIIRKDGIVYRTWTTDIDEAFEYVEHLETVRKIEVQWNVDNAVDQSVV